MRRRATFLLLGLSVFFVLLATRAEDTTDQELRALVPKIVHSWETMDFSKIGPYYAADADLTYFDLAPLKYSNWAEYKAGAQKGLFEPNQSIKATLNDDLRIHRTGNIAFATFTWQAELVSKQNAKTTLPARWTMILERRDGRWIVVHEHVSAPLPG